jgi:hypothetical protein
MVCNIQNYNFAHNMRIIILAIYAKERTRKFHIKIAYKFQACITFQYLHENIKLF